MQIFTSSILQRAPGEEAPFLEFIQCPGTKENEVSGALDQMAPQWIAECLNAAGRRIWNGPECGCRLVSPYPT